ncbi:MAG: sensor histidine kinase [Spirochaetia bacterium]
MYDIENIKKVFPLMILLAALMILVGFLFSTHNLTEAVLSNQWRVYQLNTAYYRSRSLSESNSERNQHNSDFAHLLNKTAQSPFFDKLRSVDTQLDSALSTLETEVDTISKSPEQADHDSIQDSLSTLQKYIETHIDRQLFTIRMSNNATSFALLLLMGLIVYLYYRNDLSLKQLEKAMEDKDFLIKEIHHRVKNNLAMITSFINLQSDKIQNETVVQDLKNQIRAVSTVHEKLYRDDNVSEIHFPRYIRELVEEIIYSLSHTPVSIEIDMDDVYFDPDRAVPLGLILSELATNAVKHGFDPHLEKNYFRVSLSDKNSHYTLEIANSGHPFPEDINIKTVSSLGLILIQNLVQQLRGRLTLDRNPNTRFTITFPHT